MAAWSIKPLPEAVDILVLCHSFPFPPTSGDKIRSFHIIQHLAAEHQVTVATLVRTPEQEELAAGQMENIRLVVGRVRDSVQTARMIARLPTTTPSSFGYFYSNQLRRSVAELLGRKHFDLILVHCSSVARYVEQVTDTPKILDFADMDSQKWLDYGRQRRLPLSLGYWLEGVKLEREERRLAGHFEMCTVVTPAELKTLDSFDAAALTDWFPNGVDSKYFAPGQESYDPNTIVFVGKMDYFPNEQCMVDFCRDTLPAIRAQRAQARLVIVGSKPTRAVRALSSQPGVTVTGSVDDVRPYLWRAAVAVVPLKIARGTQNKILEAMAMEVPVVASRTAVGGVDAVEGEHLLAASTPKEFATTILGLMNNPVRRQRFAAAGRERVLSHHAWDNSMRRLDSIIDRCMAGYRGRGVTFADNVK